MEKNKKIAELCTQAEALFGQDEIIRRNISTLEEALKLVGGKNAAITKKIQEYKNQEETSGFAGILSEIKQTVQDSFLEIFSADKKLSLESFSFDTDELLRTPIRKVVFTEGKDLDPVQKKLTVMLDLEHFISDYRLSLSRRTRDDDGRGGGQHSLLCELMKDGSVQYKAGYYRTGDDPPFRPGYDYKSISEEEFWKQY